MPGIYPSLISGDLLNLERTITNLEPHCSGFHVDIMDNHFVPNLTWGAQFATAIGSATTKPVWVHLMVDDPRLFVQRMTLPPESIVSFHIESGSDIQQISADILKNKWVPSLAISPKTDVEKVFPHLDVIDHVLLMSVEPGFSGQQFLPHSAQRLETLIQHRIDHNLDFVVGMDGGINTGNIANLFQKGAQHFAIASGVFAHNNPVEALQKLNELTK